MQLVNLKTDEVIALRFKRGTDRIKVHDRVIFLSKSFCILNRIKAGSKISFINDQSDWKFYISDDPDGFPLMSSGRKTGALQIFHAGLSTMIAKSTKCERPISFEIKPTALVQYLQPRLRTV